MKKVWMGTLLATSILLAGCGNKEAFKPKEINLQTDICEICNMTIADEKYAGQIALKNGDYESFDDLGCLMKEYSKKEKDKKTDEIGEMFIKVASSKEWVDVEKAAYVHDDKASSPMGYNVVAFKDEASAKAFVEKKGKGKVMKFEDLKSYNWGA